MDYTVFYKSKTGNKLILCFIFIFLTLSFFAQQNTNNPFSSNGIGDMDVANHPVYNALGNTLAAQMDSITVNFYNPSSYANISKGQPIFSIGLDNTFHISNSGGNKETGSYTQINHFAFGIAFAKIMGASFGLRPFSRSSYQFYESDPLNSSKTMRHLYQGKGNSNLFFGGLAVNALNLKRHKLGVGANLGFLFGSTVNTQTAYIDNGASVHGGVMYSTTYFLRSFYYELGLNYQFLIGQDRIILGAAFTPRQNVTATHIYEKAYTKDVDDFDDYAYILSDQVKGSVTLPQTLDIGLQYVLNTRKRNQNAKLNSRLTFTVDYKMNQWTDYRENFTTTTGNSYRNTTAYAVGIEYVPQQLFLDRVTTGYLSKVRYRIGGSISQLPYAVSGTYADRKTITAGFGFPFLIQRSISSVNFSFGYTNQTIPGNASYNEKFFNFSLGVSFAPSINDRWFRKYKID